ncbi:MAG: hypothetical protein GX567_17400 [Clostridia bacterium]|mgnify:CR=1 FL=1|nr:hypothetical protein [Clostridia bacterium]
MDIMKELKSIKSIEMSEEMKERILKNINKVMKEDGVKTSKRNEELIEKRQ